MSDIYIMIAGDYSPKERFQEALDRGKYKSLFPNIQEIIAQTDYSVVNFETVIPTSQSKPIDKFGSHLSTKENSLEALSFLGFRMLTMANNHFMDYGADAMENTQQLAKKWGFDMLGVGKNLEEASRYKVVGIRNKRVAFINVCEHEFSIATEEKAGCNPLDIIDVSLQINRAKKEADFVVVIVHGGNEHYKLPSPRMKKWYRFFVEQGADAVINHHQHCYTGYEVYKEKPIFYGIGNFCFDSKSDIKLRHKTYNYGFMLKLKLSETIGFELIPYEQCYKKPGVYLLKDEEKSNFFEDIQNLNAFISNDKLLEKEFRDMAIKKRKHILHGLTPYSCRVLNSLYSRGFLPSFLTQGRLKRIRAILECEAHNDVFMQNLKS